MSRTVVMAGGGTGGHVIPALAVAAELQRRGHRPVFIGTRRGYEARLVPQAGFPIEWIEAGGFNRAGVLQKLRTLAQLPLSVLAALRCFAKHRPAAVFSMGGYVAVPVMIAAVLRRVPMVLMEPNAIPGLANRRMARWVRKALVNFPETADCFPPGVAEVTGVPVREAFFRIGSRGAGPFTLLVTGGSQGSRTLNDAVRAAWPHFARELAGRIRIVHQTGASAERALAEDFAATGLAGEVRAFIADMPAAFAAADLVLCRSGASTVSELAAAGRPAILVPFPFAADNHQMRNAEAFARAGAGMVIEDKDLTGERLFRELAALMEDTVRLDAMAEAARSLAHPDAAARAADILESL